MSNETLPYQPTPFIGRETELDELAARLQNPACRLITIIGSGGVGKTRLAAAAAVQAAADFADGVVFVDLQPLNNNAADSLPAAIADALSFSLSGQTPPQSQLFRYLTHKNLLLLLDNFEHLLDNASFLSQLLAQTAAVKLLVTSREALNLQEEWLYTLHGLPVPPQDAALDELDAYDAVQFFLTHARQIRPGFSLAEEKTGLLRICQLVDGLPLALKLATSWTKMLSCTAIADEIERNITFLTAQQRNLPQKHRSMQVVLEQSWRLLSEEEQRVFKRLSLFQGDFDAAAGQQVAETTLTTLLTLVDKSLLQSEGNRYSLHALARQFGRKKLAQTPAECTQTQRRHGAFYTSFLHQQLDDLLGGGQYDALERIEPELENIRTAWQWAVDQRDVAALQRAAHPLSLFYQFQSRFLEGAQRFSTAAEQLLQGTPSEQRDRVLLIILVDQAWFDIRLGRLQTAEAVLNQCRTLYRRLGIPPVPGHGTDPALPLGIIASTRGDVEQAAALGKEVLHTSQQHDHLWNRQFAHYLLTRTALAQGDYETAQTQAQAAWMVTQETGDQWFMAYCHNELGNIARARKEYQLARQHYAASYTIRKLFHDQEGMAVALNHLGVTAGLQGHHHKARRLYQRSRTIYEEINDKGGLATVLKGLGTAACALEEYGTAQQHLQEALKIAYGIHFTPLVFEILVALGEVYLHIGRLERAITLLTLIEHDPAGSQPTRQQAQHILAHYKSEVPAELWRDALARSQTQSLAELIEQVLAEPVGPEETAVLPSSTPDRHEDDGSSTSSSTLVEPLTGRETEVLQLLAQGLTNREIAQELTIVVGTVKAHNHNIYGKLGVDNRTQAVARAMELSLL